MIQHIHHHCVLVLSGTIEREPFFGGGGECLWEGTKTTDIGDRSSAKVNKQIVSGPLPLNCPKFTIQSEAVALWIWRLAGGELG